VKTFLRKKEQTAEVEAEPGGTRTQQSISRKLENGFALTLSVKLCRNRPKIKT